MHVTTTNMHKKKKGKKFNSKKYEATKKKVFGMNMAKDKAEQAGNR